MFCPGCGKEVGGGGFCSNCGTKTEGSSPAALAGGTPGNQNLVLIGGALLLISFFMPWIHLGIISLSGFNLTKVASGSEKILAVMAWLVPIGGGITAYFAYTKNKNVTKAALFSCVIASIVWVWLFLSKGSEIEKISGSFTDVFEVIGIGFYILLAGIVCLAITLEPRFQIMILKIFISSGLLYFVLSKTGIEKVVSTLRGINILSFIFAVLIYMVTIYISTIRWRLLLHDKFGMKRLVSLYFIGSFFNHLLPGIIGGDAVKAYYLYRDTGRGSSAVASVFMDRYVGFTALMLVGLTAFPFGFSYFRGSYIEWVLPLIVLLFVAGSFVVFGLKIGRRIKLLSGFYDYFTLYKEKKTVIVKALLLSLIIQTIVILAVYVLSRGLKVDVPLLPLFIFIPVISTIASLPISISGLGVREASFVLLFGFLGISPVQATAVSFAYFLSVATGSLPGLIEYLRYNKGM